MNSIEQPPCLSRALANWIFDLNPSDIPGTVIQDAKLRILDTVGVTIGAVETELAQSIRQSVVRLRTGSGARILGFGDHVAADCAVIANGTMAHALDFDDTHAKAAIHVSAPIVTTAMAFGQALHAHGRDILTAAVAGAEVVCRLGSMVSGRFQAKGLHPTGIIGTIGAACVASKLMKNSPEQTQSAIGLAASQASGIMESFGDGTWSRRLHSGWAAHCGILAAQFAESGFRGAQRSLDGRFGLFNVFLGREDYPYHEVTDNLGTSWIGNLSSIKPYPCGHIVQPFVTAALELRQLHHFASSDVAAVECRLSEWMIPMICEPRDAKIRPTSEAAAMGSAQYCVAVALHRGEFGLTDFEDQARAKPEVLALASKIAHAADSERPPVSQYKGWVIVRLKDGRELERVVPHALGSPENPMTERQIIEKFTGLADSILASGKAGRVVDDVMQLDRISNTDGLIENCCAGGG
jgi:2-methylcitrate dehydratase PrpD